MAFEGGDRKKLGDILRRRPQFVGDSPLDRYFQRLDEELISIIKDVGVEKFKEGYEGFVTKCLDFISELHTLVLDKDSECEAKNLIPISLHDLGYFDELVNLIVVHGIYANIPPGVGVPLPQRQLKSFREDKIQFKIPANHSRNLQILARSAETLYMIFLSKITKQDIVKGILLKGTGYLDTITAFVVLSVDDPCKQKEYYEKLDFLESIQNTYTLYSTYSLLVQSTKNPIYSDWVLNKLSTLPVRNTDGIEALFDFVMGIREDVRINTENFKRLNQILTSKPKKMKNVEYFLPLFDQIYSGLADVNKPVLISYLNNLVDNFYFKNKRIVGDFLFRKINKIILNPSGESYSHKQLNDVINVLISLSKNPSSEVIQALVSSNNRCTFYLNLWIYALYLKKNQKIQPNINGEQILPYYNVILSLIVSYMKIDSDVDIFNHIIQNMVNLEHDTWEYRIDFENQLPYIVSKSNSNIKNELKIDANKNGKLIEIKNLFLDIDLAIDTFIELLNVWNNDLVTKNIFLTMLNRWVQSSSSRPSETLVSTDKDVVSQNLLTLIDFKLLEQINDKFKMNLIEDPHDILDLIRTLLPFTYKKQQQKKHIAPDSDDEEDIDESKALSSFSILLKLLTAILDTKDNKQLNKDSDILFDIAQQLKKLPQNLETLALSDRIDTYLFNNPTPSANTISPHDQASLDSALSNLNDQLAPVRAQGLYQLRLLLEKRSTVVNISMVLKLHLDHLKSSEPFIYLNVIKSLSQLCEIAPQNSIPLLLKEYRDNKPAHRLDFVLRLGEVFVNYITAQGDAFLGPHAIQLVQVCLSIVRERDSTNNLIRMSAMSLLGLVLKTNPIGIPDYITEILDCAFGILQLESDPVIRRSAVHTIHDLLYSTGLTMISAPYNPIKIKNMLEYARSQDDDYFVCEDIYKLLEILKVQDI